MPKYVPQKWRFPFEIRAPSNTCSFGPTGLHPKQHFDWISRFCWVHGRDQLSHRQTDRQTDNDTSVTIGRTLCYTQLCHQMIVTTEAKYRTVWSAEFDASTVRHSTSTQCSTTRETPYSRWYLCQILTDFHNSFTGWFSGKFSVKWLLLVISPCLAYVATLTCETLMSENKRLTIRYRYKVQQLHI